MLVLLTVELLSPRLFDLIKVFLSAIFGVSQSPCPFRDNISLIGHFFEGTIYFNGSESHL